MMNQKQRDLFTEKLGEMLKERLKDFRVEEWSIDKINEQDRLAPGKTKISILCILKEGGTAEIKFEFPSFLIKEDLLKIRGDKI